MTALTSLLSRAYVAFTIELDNELEHGSEHRTARGGSGARLTSSTMWFNCLRFLPDEGIPVEELLEAALTPTNFNGMIRWGYISLADDIVRATRKGKVARAALPQFVDMVDARWRERFGSGVIDDLRDALVAVAASFDRAIPDVMPILGPGLSLAGRVRKARRAAPEKSELEGLSLLSLLAKPLIAVGALFERDSDVSLAICANVVRVIDGPARVRDLPARSGISKQAVEMALSFLTRRGYASLSTYDRSRTVTLTEKGVHLRERFPALLETVEGAIAEKAGSDAFRRLRAAVEAVTVPRETLLAGLEPYSDNWRAKMGRRQHLPEFPMPLHRGGYPDGS